MKNHRLHRFCRIQLLKEENLRHPEVTLKKPLHSGKKKITQIVTLAACYSLLASLFISCAKREIKNINSQGTNIICFGDSITFGYGAEPGEDYPSELAKLTGIPVINAGVNGDTSSEAIKRTEKDVLEKEPLLVIIEFGGNDFLGKIPLEKTTENIEEMLKRIQAHGAMAAIADISNNMVMGNYRKEFKRLSKKYKTIFIPKLFSGILVNPSLKSDAIHPSAQGYKLIAQRIYCAIMPFLNRNIALKEEK